MARSALFRPDTNGAMFAKNRRLIDERFICRRIFYLSHPSPPRVTTRVLVSFFCFPMGTSSNPSVSIVASYAVRLSPTQSTGRVPNPPDTRVPIFPNTRWTCFETPAGSYRKNPTASNPFDRTHTIPVCPTLVVRNRGRHRVGRLFFFFRSELFVERIKCTF